ncbi:AAA+ ATPase domain-containing protein [Tanacetum coccineum]
MASMNTRLNIEKLDENIVQKHGGSKQVGLKQLGSKQVGFKQLGQKQVGFKQLGPGVETGFHGVQDEKRVWFEVELQGSANITVTGVPGQEGAEGGPRFEVPALDKDAEYRLCLSVTPKAISVEGQKTTPQTNYILKILGLNICADTIHGDAMKRGISGGEMIVGPAKALFMDEISNGLDSSTAYQIIACLQQFAHLTGASVLISLLQPSPEVFDLFDDIMLMAQGMIMYHSPRTDILDNFEGLGFRCPKRKGVDDFLQEVMHVNILLAFVTTKKFSPLVLVFASAYIKNSSNHLFE